MYLTLRIGKRRADNLECREQIAILPNRFRVTAASSAYRYLQTDGNNTGESFHCNLRAQDATKHTEYEILFVTPITNITTLKLYPTTSMYSSMLHETFFTKNMK
jgi:hypothetical protein